MTAKEYLEQIKLRFFVWLEIDGQPCHSFGGVVRHIKLPDPMIGMEVRVCTKNRWHIDSHAYEFVKFPYEYPKEDV